MTRRTPRAAVEADPTSDIAFGPRPAGREPPKYDWAAIATKLRKRPGEWAEIFKQDKSTYYTSLMQGSIVVFGQCTSQRVRVATGKGFEVWCTNTRRRPGETRLCDLWMRYVPEKDTTRESESK